MWIINVSINVYGLLNIFAFMLSEHTDAAVPVPKSDARLITAVLGEPVILHCSTEPERSVTWMFRSLHPDAEPIELSSGGEVINGHGEYFELDTKARDDRNLVIKSANFSNVGEYTCDEDIKGRRHIIKLNVSAAYPSTFTAETGENVTLPCPLTSLRSNAEWSYGESSTTDVQPINVDGTKYSVDKTRRGFRNIIVRDVQEADSGYYICSENKINGSRIVRKLSVSRATSTTEMPYTQLVITSGKTTKLSCHTELVEPVNWYYQTAPDSPSRLVSSGDRVVDLFNFVGYVETNSLGDFNLVIRRTEPADSGFYTCVENSGSGPSRHRVHVQVTDDSLQYWINFVVLPVLCILVFLIIIGLTVHVSMFWRHTHGSAHSNQQSSGVKEGLTMKTNDSLQQTFQPPGHGSREPVVPPTCSQPLLLHDSGNTSSQCSPICQSTPNTVDCGRRSNEIAPTLMGQNNKSCSTLDAQSTCTFAYATDTFSSNDTILRPWRRK